MENTVKKIIAAVVVLVLLAAVVPIMGAVSKEIPEVSRSNIGGGATNVAYTMMSDETVDVSFSDGALVIDGSTVPARSVYPFCSETCVMYIDSSGAPKLYYVKDDTYTRIQNITAFTAEITLSSVNVTYSTSIDADVHVEIPYDKWAGYRATDGDHRLIDCNSVLTKIYLNDPNQLYAWQYSGGALFISSTGEDCEINGSSDGVVIDATFEPIAETDEIISIDVGGADSKLSYVYNGNTYTPHIVIVPSSVSGFTPELRPAADLMAIVPVIVVLLIFTSIAAWLLWREK